MIVLVEKNNEEYSSITVGNGFQMMRGIRKHLILSSTRCVKIRHTNKINNKPENISTD